MKRLLAILAMMLIVGGCDEGFDGQDGGLDGGSDADAAPDSGGVTGLNCEWSCVYADECPVGTVQYSGRICPDFGGGPGECCGPPEDR